ncbi:prophage Lp1 protein 23 [Lactiplantibacillus plantarum]|nr:prophage Lp1 protein 23 [Lactiplantibacillus plantarum]
MLATGDEPELHRMLLERRQHGKWQFPVVIEKEKAKPWDDVAYLASMNPDPLATEKEQIMAIRHYYHKGIHTIRQLSESTGIFRNRVSFLMHKYSLRLGSDYWRAEKEGHPDGIITSQTAHELADKLCANVDLINNARGTNDTVCGYYISKVPRI